MTHIKICFVTREYAHDKLGRTGGIGVFLKQFTQQLKHHNFKITVFSFGSTSVSFDDDGVSVIKIKDLSGFNEWIKSPLRRYKIPGYITIKIVLEYINRFYISMYLSLFVQRRHFDIIEFHDYGGDVPFFIGSPPKVIRCHGSALTLHQFMGYTNRITDTIFEKKMFRRFYKNVVAVSDYSAQITQKAFQLKKKPSVIYNGVLLSVNNKIAQDNYLNKPTINQSIFYFGSVRERKGIDLACEIFNTIIDKFPEASFHVLGNNNNNHWNKAAVNILSEKALSRTRYYGAIPNAKIFEYLHKAHVVIFPSYGENFSIALLEVMSIGKIAITSKIPAFQEIIEHKVNGFIAGTTEDYITYISKTFNKKIEVDNISKNAKTTIENKFNLIKIVEENITYYKSLL